VVAGVDVSLIEQLETIRAAIDEIMTSCSRITVDMSETSRVAQLAEVDMTAAEDAVDRAEEALREAERLLNTEGREALQQVSDRQRELGHQSARMTQLSQEARELANQCVSTLRPWLH